MHLADAFIQSNLQYIQVIHFFLSVCSLGIKPKTFALLTQSSATEPQEHHPLSDKKCTSLNSTTILQELYVYFKNY